jgi:uncharacterized protein (TIGR02145 family)
MKNLNFLGIITVMLALISSSCKKDKAPNQLIDIERNVYKTVQIGNQVWMAENLKTTKLNDGTPIAFVTDPTTWADVNLKVPMACYYDNDENNLNKYGLLYNWYAVGTGKLAPKGWHVASDADWEKLRDYLIANGYNYDGTNFENKIGKSLAATSGWTASQLMGVVGNNQLINNKSGFNGLPAGARSDSNGRFLDLGFNAYWWSLTEKDAFYSNHWGIYSDYSNLLTYDISKGLGISVRCVKD